METTRDKDGPDRARLAQKVIAGEPLDAEDMEAFFSALDRFGGLAGMLAMCHDHVDVLRDLLQEQARESIPRIDEAQEHLLKALNLVREYGPVED